MSHRVAFSADAVQDLKDVYDYLAPLAGDAVATAYLERIYRFCLTLDLFPERGIRRDDIVPGLRIMGYRRQASIAVRIDATTVTIVRIYHRGRNINAELRGDGSTLSPRD